MAMLLLDSSRPTVDLGALHVDGLMLRTPNGAPFSHKHVTAFDAMRLLRVGELAKLKAYAAWTRGVGGNGWRVFGGWSRTAFDYRNVGDYFVNLLPGLCQLLGDEGLRGELSCIQDAIPSSENQQREFLNQCADVLVRFPWMIMKKGNEPWKNGLDPLLFDVQRSGLLVSHGSAAPDALPYVPSAGWTAIHPPRTDDWARKPGKDAYETRALTRDVVIPNEPKGFWESSGESGSRTGNAQHAFVAGVGARMFCPGITAHGDTNTMQLCMVPGPHETECVREMFRGVDLVPAEAPTWTYARYGPANPGVPMPIQDDLGPGKLTDHMHAMLGPSAAIVCNYYPSPGWVAVAANGWRIVRQDGPAVLCER